MVNGISSANIQKLYQNKELTEAQKAVIDEVAADGNLTQADLDAIKAQGLDTDVITEKFQIDDANGVGETTGKYDKTDKDGVIADLKAKYPVEGGVQGDAYSMGNPELTSLSKLMDDGVIGDLIASGFSKADVADIISGLFPNAGIRSQGQGYTAPYGHDTQAKEIYDNFTKLMSQASAATTSPEIEALQSKIDENNTQITSNNMLIEANNNQIEKLQAEVDEIKQEIQEAVDAAIKESEEIAEEQKQAVSDAVSKNLNEFANSDGNMTYEDFQKALNGDLDALDQSGESRLAAVVGKMLDAEGKMSQLSDLVGRIGNLLAENDDLVADNAKLTELNTGYAKDLANEQAKLAEEASNCETDPDCQRCDPIGFEKDGARYDFFTDTDNDGMLSNQNEFLGAEDGWASMQALDTNGDGKVTRDEMADLKMVQTNADGTQQVVNATDVFDTDDDFVDLNSYKDVNKDVNKDVHLLGNFNVNFDSETANAQNIEGYNTLDSIDWLKDNYDFSDLETLHNTEANGTAGLEAITTENFGRDLDAELAEMDKLMTDGWNALGVNREDIKENVKALEKDGNDAAARVQDTFDRIAKKQAEAEEAEKAEQEQAEADVVAQQEQEAATANATEEDATIANWKDGDEIPVGYKLDTKTNKLIKA